MITKERLETDSNNSLLLNLQETRDLGFHYETELIKRGVKIELIKRSIGFYNKRT